MPDRAELDGLADQHPERNLHGEPGEDNCPCNCHGHITLQTRAMFRAASHAPRLPDHFERTNHEQDDKPLGIGCAIGEHPRSLPEYILLPWSTSFEDPIDLPDGRKLLTLKDAADYITKLPKAESDLPEWQTAIEVLLLCSRNGPTMMARIGVMNALNRHVERVFNPDRKETHWGKRKLKRDRW